MGGFIVLQGSHKKKKSCAFLEVNSKILNRKAWGVNCPVGDISYDGNFTVSICPAVANVLGWDFSRFCNCPRGKGWIYLLGLYSSRSNIGEDNILFRFFDFFSSENVLWWKLSWWTLRACDRSDNFLSNFHEALLLQNDK